MITIEYDEKLIEVPLNIWLDFEEEQGEALDFLGDELDIVLDKAGYDKLVKIAQNSKIGAKIISEFEKTKRGLD